MANDTPITLIGNLGGDPELRFTPSGIAVANFSVAVTPRIRTADGEWEDGEPSWYNCTAWRDMAENVAASLQKGQRAVVYGTLVQRHYETRDGQQRISVEVNVTDVGPSLLFGTTQYTKGAASTQPAPQQQAQQNKGRQRNMRR